MSELASLVHDLRAPLARAKTFAKLLQDASPEEREECLSFLLKALEEMDEKLSSLARP